MKQSLVGLLAFILVASAAPAPAQAADVTDGCTLLTTMLEVGSKGEEVLALETFLKKEGYLKGGANTVFNTATKNALIAFQLKSGSIGKATHATAGKTGAPTRTAIANASCKKKDLQTPGSCVIISRNLTRENNGEVFVDDIKKLQRVLMAKKYLSATDVTGYFGPVTRQAVANFQLDNQIIFSRTSDGAGVVGPTTREWIQENTCGTGVIEKSAASTTASYVASVKVLKGVNAASVVGDRIMTLTIKPKEDNADLRQIRLQVKTESADVHPSTRIDYIDVFNPSIVSRNRAAFVDWEKIDSKTYEIVLDGAKEELVKGKDNNFNIVVVTKASGRTAVKNGFTASLPEDSVRIGFRNIADANLGAQTWGAPGLEATFSVGVAAATPPATTGGGNSADTPDPSDEEPAAAEVATPTLSALSPATGSFGTSITLTGKNFAAVNNIAIRHPETNSETMVYGAAGSNNRITFTFPGRGREFVRPNGTKVSGKTGAYGIRVISNGLTSNAMVFKVQ